MGGGAFAQAKADGEPTLSIPRMRPDEYERLKESHLTRLTTYFGPRSISCLKEAPEKQDYGDIDMTVATTDHIDWQDVAKSIGAAAWVDRGSDSHPKCSFAVPLSGEYLTAPPVMYTWLQGNEANKRKASPVYIEEKYAQLDLERIPPGLRDWRTFYGSYGDLTGMVGHIITNLGFDLTDRGLRLRFKELDECRHPEWSHVKPAVEEARIMLSSDPKQVMEFLELSTERYDQGFETIEEMFTWLADCKMLSEHSRRRERTELSRDRQKFTRPIFVRFFREWLPKTLDARRAAAAGASENGAEGAGEDRETSPERRARLAELRHQYMDEALAFFGKRVEYDTMHTAFLRKRANETAAHLLKPIIAEYSGKKDKKLTELIRAFRRNVKMGGNSPEVLDTRRSDVDSELWTFLDESGRALKHEARLSDWIRLHFDTVKEVERTRAKGGAV